MYVHCWWKISLQRDILKVLQAMMRFLGGRKVLHQHFGSFVIDCNHHYCQFVSICFICCCPCHHCWLTIKAKAKIRQRSKVEEEWLKANVVLINLSEGPRKSIGQIVCTFGDKLMVFRYPPAVVSSVQCSWIIVDVWVVWGLCRTY